ncbi:MAG: hypothetical protein JSR91_13575 [Proteobacteria bacterium]|nr:hypothetical protein [Pseudomonadota bacterium]
MATRVSDAAHRMCKQPHQARSRDTVAVIIEADAQVLVRKGWSGFNTNDVAAAAGALPDFPLPDFQFSYYWRVRERRGLLGANAQRPWPESDGFAAGNLGREWKRLPL